MLWLVGLRGRDLRGRHGRRGCGLHGLLHRRSLYWHGRFYRRNGLVLVGIRGIRHEMPPVRKRQQPTCRVKEWSRACEKARSIHRFSSSTSTRNGYCLCWFEKQPERRSRRPAMDAGVGRPVCAERKSNGGTLVPARQGEPQLPLRPYSHWHASCANIPRDPESQGDDMESTEKASKAGCSSAACSCKEASVDVRGKKYCSSGCASGTQKGSCSCGHPPCKPK